MSIALCLMISKLFLYVVPITIVILIGQGTSFWKGWKLITIGMIIPEVTVLFQILDYFTDGGLVPLIAPFLSLISMMYLLGGFFCIWREWEKGAMKHSRLARVLMLVLGKIWKD